MRTFPAALVAPLGGSTSPWTRCTPQARWAGRSLGSLGPERSCGSGFTRSPRWAGEPWFALRAGLAFAASYQTGCNNDCDHRPNDNHGLPVLGKREGAN